MSLNIYKFYLLFCTIHLFYMLPLIVNDGNEQMNINMQSVTTEQIENVKRLILDECGFLVDEVKLYIK